jgi:hypothetical protein
VPSGRKFIVAEHLRVITAMRIRSPFAACVVLLFVGCGGQTNSPSKDKKFDLPRAENHFAARARPTRGDNQNPDAVGREPAQPGEPEPAAVIERKIIRTADLRIIVDDFDHAEQELRKIIAQCKNCYVASAESGGSAGAPRTGKWKVRVPVIEFDGFVDALIRLGVPERKTVDSQDVTEEYYDLDTRTKNKKTEEQRLLKHLEKSTAKLEDILAVEREISRVRGEIEHNEGKLRLLANLTTLTTVTVTVQEIKNYIPPQTPTFAASIGDTFTSSVDLLVGFGKRAVLVAVALSPWLPLIFALCLAIWLPVRRAVRHAAVPSPPAR